MGVPKYIIAIMQRLNTANHAAFLAGGCVRDYLLGRRPADWDIATSARPEELLGLFARSIPTGLRHGTVTLRYRGRFVEATTFRLDGEYSDNRRPDSVEFTDDLLADLARRDFTINAMAMDKSLSLCDPFGGRADLAAGLIRCVGDPKLRFFEDALRMLRALRFSAQLGFRIEEQTMDAIRSCAHLCAALSPERVRGELVKVLRSPRPQLIADMISAGLLDSFLLRGPVGLSQLAGLPIYARLAHLCRALQSEGMIEDPAAFMSALRFDKKSMKTAADAVLILQSGKRDYKRLLRDYGEPACLAAYPKSRALRSVLRSGECYSLADLAISGRELAALGYKGSALGEQLDRLLDHVIDFPDDNRAEVLYKLALRNMEGCDG